MPRPRRPIGPHHKTWLTETEARMFAADCGVMTISVWEAAKSLDRRREVSSVEDYLVETGGADRACAQRLVQQLTMLRDSHRSPRSS